MVMAVIFCRHIFFLFHRFSAQTSKQLKKLPLNRFAILFEHFSGPLIANQYLLMYFMGTAILSINIAKHNGLKDGTYHTFEISTSILKVTAVSSHCDVYGL